MDLLHKVEELYNKPFDAVKPSYTPVNVFTVELKSFNDISKSSILGRTRDPRFTIKCPHLETQENEFETMVYTEQRTGTVDEAYSFVINDEEAKGDISVEITLSDEDPYIGAGNLTTAWVNITGLQIGDSRMQTVKFPNEHGSVDIKVSKQHRSQPDFRLGYGISDEEKKFRLARIPKCFEALQNIPADDHLPDDSKPKSVHETPIISIVGSGGGYRAATGLSGGLEALKDAGVYDAVTYLSGLSGSSWCINSAFTNQNLEGDCLEKQSEILKAGIGKPMSELWRPRTFYKYKNSWREEKSNRRQYISLVDFWGYTIGRNIVGEEMMNRTMTDGQDYISSGKVPYPIISTLHVKDNESAAEFHANVENTPFEISIPNYGIGIKPEHHGSEWNKGIVTRKCKEFPMHVHIGAAGCAFAIKLDDYLLYGAEEDEVLLEKMENINNMEYGHDQMERSCIMQQIMKLPLFQTRSRFIGRSSEFFHFAYGLDRKVIQDEWSQTLNNLHRHEPTQPKEIEVLGNNDYMPPQVTRTDNKKCEVIDAGIGGNVCVQTVMRSQRNPDLVIVFDLNNYAEDQKFDYMPLVRSAYHCWREGIPFPQGNLSDIKNYSRPKPLIVIESDGKDDEMPTVLWFTLCNKAFRKDPDYKPRFEYPVEKDGDSFKEFDVFEKGSTYQTSHMTYTPKEFDQLRELMYYNVMSNIDVVKEQIAKAIARKQNKVEKLLSQAD